MTHRKRFFGALSSAVLILGACAGSAATDSATSNGSATPAVTDPAGVRVVSPADGAAIQDEPPADLVILDVRTAEEFAAGHLEGATMLDFYASDFGDRLAGLDRDSPYLLYCRSGNRSGQARQMMTDLGFSDVADIEGGIVAWTDAGLPVATG